MTLVSVYMERTAIMVLYELLKERTPEQSISHKIMPTLEQHTEFVRNVPYLAWYLLKEGGSFVGAIYLTKQREVGVFIFKAYQGNGYAREGIALLRAKWPGKMLANVNPRNEISRKMFEKLGGRVIQWTYELP